VDRLTYVGHSTVLLRLDGTSVLTDPVLRRWLGPLRRQGPPVDLELPEAPDAVLISHLHRDHLDLPSLRRLPPATPVVVPRGAAALASRAGGEDVREIGRGETISVGALSVTAVPALHDGRRGFRGGRWEPLGYVVAGRDQRTYFAGDTDLFSEMSDFGPLDLALLPVWGWGPSIGRGHLDPAGAARALKLLRPRVAVPIHWGTLYPLGLARIRPDRLSQPPLEFARLAAELAPQAKVCVLRPGEDMEL
jgi:L-ascorbate metabolism protein UlaG (beta-lactamase superfamily)